MPGTSTVSSRSVGKPQHELTVEKGFRPYAYEAMAVPVGPNKSRRNQGDQAGPIQCKDCISCLLAGECRQIPGIWLQEDRERQLRAVKVNEKRDAGRKG
jgi:hypothetical protein